MGSIPTLPTRYSMFTIFTTCRSFEDQRFRTIQRNAFNTWVRLDPIPEVLVFGEDPGVREHCKEFGFRQCEVAKNEMGTPLLPSMIQMAEEEATNDLLLLLSSDILLFGDIYPTAKAIKEQMPWFMGTAIKQENSDLTGEIDFTGDWESFSKRDLWSSLPTSGDFFLFPKRFFGQLPMMPPFAYGRSYCDTWVFYHSLVYGYLVNMTEAVTIVHQQHGHPWLRPEGSVEQERNQEMAGPEISSTAISDAKLRLTKELTVTAS